MHWFAGLAPNLVLGTGSNSRNQIITVHIQISKEWWFEPSILWSCLGISRLLSGLILTKRPGTTIPHMSRKVAGHGDGSPSAAYKAITWVVAPDLGNIWAWRLQFKHSLERLSPEGCRSGVASARVWSGMAWSFLRAGNHFHADNRQMQLAKQTN